MIPAEKLDGGPRDGGDGWPDEPVALLMSRREAALVRARLSESVLDSLRLSTLHDGVTEILGLGTAEELRLEAEEVGRVAVRLRRCLGARP